jgi:hypothetical protein
MLGMYAAGLRNNGIMMNSEDTINKDMDKVATDGCCDLTWR